MRYPLVSVITGAYRSNPQHLRAALTSAVRQSYENLEIMVSDDSPDSSLQDVVRALGDRRLRYRRNETPLGAAANHWRCIREARGEYVAILNHDDMFEPTFVERLVGPLQTEAKAVVAFSDHWIIDALGNRMINETETATDHYGRRGLMPGLHRPFDYLILGQTIPMAVGALFRRQSVPASLPAQAGPAYDLWLAYILCRTGYGAWYVPDRLSSWRAHSDNLTSAGGIDWSYGAACCWAEFAREAADAGIIAAARSKEALAHRVCARWYYKRGRRAEARMCAMRSLRANASWKAVVLYGAACLPVSFGRVRPSRGQARR
jgi:glycosyltransferase involved in cell wall biosynthesis